MIYEDCAAGTRSYWMAISQCAWCNGIKLGKWYLRIPGVGKVTYQRAVKLPFGMSLCVITTHGLCPKCAEQISGKGQSDLSP